MGLFTETTEPLAGAGFQGLMHFPNLPNQFLINVIGTSLLTLLNAREVLDKVHDF
jgi:hypothetical protein